MPDLNQNTNHQGVTSMQCTTNPQFVDLVALEPKLDSLLIQARNRHWPHRSYSKRLDIWYSEFKPRVAQLVGFRRDHAVLGTANAYDVAYDRILTALMTGK